MQRIIEVGDQVPRRGNAFSAWVGRVLLWLLGWRIIGSLPDASKAVVIGAPHTSNRDGLVAAGVILALRLRITIMAKDKLFRGPFGFFFRFLGGIPVDRNHPHGLVGASVEKFQEKDKLFLGMAPEGTRKGAEKWKTGFYQIALAARVPVVVAVLDFGKKELRLPLTLTPSGDLDADMQKILDCYRGVVPARPERLSVPLRENA
jgi:1-acyl-sn-glycerol-3-phosphate acyltransferase